MKALVMFELPEDWEINDLYLLHLWVGNAKRKEEIAYKKMPIKPLPEHKDLYEEEPTMMFINGSVVDSFAYGWNACLDKILGDENESDTDS